ncbi:hypothetical protein EV1_004885 [Malus domestica]
MSRSKFANWHPVFAPPPSKAPPLSITTHRPQRGRQKYTESEGEKQFLYKQSAEEFCFDPEICVEPFLVQIEA